MILVDSSVWIDYFRNEPTPQTAQLDLWLDTPVELIAAADLVIFEVMRGFRYDRARRAAEALLLDLPRVEIGGIDNALRAAEHYRILRARGHTVGSPIDVLLASYCITHDHLLLHRDGDFDQLETLRGLKVWRQ